MNNVSSFLFYKRRIFSSFVSILSWEEAGRPCFHVSPGSGETRIAYSIVLDDMSGSVLYLNIVPFQKWMHFHPLPNVLYSPFQQMWFLTGFSRICKHLDFLQYMVFFFCYEVHNDKVDWISNSADMLSFCWGRTLLCFSIAQRVNLFHLKTSWL